MLEIMEIGVLVGHLRATSGFIDRLRRHDATAQYVQYPKIPPILSESLAVHAIRNGRLLSEMGPFRSVSLGGREADIIAVTNKDKRIMIETKAAGSQEFATFGPKDYDADILLWLLFGDSLRGESSNRCRVLICPKPSINLPWKKNRVTTAQLKASWKGTIAEEVIQLPA